MDDEDEEALDLELQFLTREPREAFAVFDAEGGESWTEFFASVRGRREVRGGLVEVIL